MRSDLIVVSADNLFPLCCRYMDHMCGLREQRRNAEKLRAKAYEVWSAQFAGRTIPILAASFGREHVREDRFVFGTDSLYCKALSQIKANTVKGGYLFLFHAPDRLEQQPALELYLADCWQTALVDAGRDWLISYFGRISKEENDEEIFVTDTFGPGFYGMDVEEIRIFFKLLDYEKLGMQLLDSGMMLPEKSAAGLVLVLTEESPFQSADCANCKAEYKGCLMCGSARKTKGRFLPAEREAMICPD